MIKVRVNVTLKPDVLDPQGKAITNTVHTLGYKDVKEVRASKFFDLIIDSNDVKHVKHEVDEICDKVLANPNIETYNFKIIEE